MTPAPYVFRPCGVCAGSGGCPECLGGDGPYPDTDCSLCDGTTDCPECGGAGTEVDPMGQTPPASSCVKMYEDADLPAIRLAAAKIMARWAAVAEANPAPQPESQTS